MRTSLFAVAVALAGCADDAPAGTAADGAVAVVVTLDGAPAAGVRVVFQDAAGFVVAGDHATTDATGTASALGAAGGTVTVVEPRPTATPTLSGTVLDTITDIAPGDVLHVDIGATPPPATASNIVLTLPVDAAPGVATYELFTTCASAEVAIPAADVVAPFIVELGSCAGGVADLLVATADASGTPIDFLYAPGVEVGGDAGSGTPVALHGSYAPLPAVADAITSVPTTTAAIDGELWLSSARGGVFDTEVDVGASSAITLPLQAPPITGAVADTAIVVLSGNGIYDAQQVVRWQPLPATATPLAYSAVKLADILRLPVLDLGQHAVTWSVGPGGGTPDASLAEIACRRAGSDAAPVTWFWRVAGPGTADGQLTLPVLPVDGFDWNPGSGDATLVAYTGGIALPGGYGAARPLIYAATGLAAVAAASSTGTVVQLLALGPVEPERTPPASLRRSRLRPDVSAGRSDR